MHSCVLQRYVTLMLIRSAFNMAGFRQHAAVLAKMFDVDLSDVQFCSAILRLTYGSA